MKTIIDTKGNVQDPATKLNVSVGDIVVNAVGSDYVIVRSANEGIYYAMSDNLVIWPLRGSEGEPFFFKTDRLLDSITNISGPGDY